MKLAMLNTYDSEGGAAIATYRLHTGLRSVGVKSSMLVLRKETSDQTVISPNLRTLLQKLDAYIPSRLDERITRFIQAEGRGFFSPARRPDQLAAKIGALNPDVVHLFWVNSGFLKIETLRQFRKPIVWTLHDMWPFTGGCHYDGGCGRFQQACGKCPTLGSDREHDLSRHIWERKHKSWRDIPITVVATSHWIASMARSSSLFKDLRIEVVPNGIDTSRYKPIEKRSARAAFSFPQDKHLVLFSAFSATKDKRKGNQFLIPALKALAQDGWGDKMELVVIGASQSERLPDMGMKVNYMGHMRDEISQVLLYSAADVTVAPSIQENLSNAVMESLSCGTPVVAFNIGGMPDMVDHQQMGYLALPYESEDLASGIAWVLEDRSRHELLSRQARNKVVENYALETVASRYLALYQSII